MAVSQFEVDVEADFHGGCVSRIMSAPRDSGVEALLGTSSFAEFRKAVRAMACDGVSSSLTRQLLDDFPMAVMLSGRVLRTHGISLGDPNSPLPVDVCAGWVPGGSLLKGYSDLGPPLTSGPIVSSGPSIGAVEREDDLIGWHHDEQLPPDSTRRYRCLDIWIEDHTGRAECYFRDSHSDRNALETVVHEYSVQVSVDLQTMMIITCEANPGALPYRECPNAASSADRLTGVALQGLRRSVRDTFTGPSTCTHLNDALRSLEDVGPLLKSLV